MKCYRCKSKMVRDEKSNKNTLFCKVWKCTNCGHEAIEESDK